ncbi:MAG: enoyl-CoA hydratase-related protein [Bacillota bacterium]
MNWETITVSYQEHWALITLNRPEAHNAINMQLARDLLEALAHISASDDVWAAGITGAGDKAFCVGADLKERHGMDIAQTRSLRQLTVRMYTSVVNFPKPLVAAVDGYALGGGFEIALGCDLIIATERAVFGLPEVGLGIIPGGGGTQLLPRTIGRQKAKELIFTGRHVPAAEGEKIGFVNKVVPVDELMRTCTLLMEEMTRNAPLSLRQAKRAINIGLEIDLNSGYALEDEVYTLCLASEDRIEGIQAFIEKRKPVYRGK